MNLNHIVSPLAVAVSGGADSLCATLLLHSHYPDLIAFTVDHGLRKESFLEALKVKKILEDKGIQHHILFWEHQGVATQIQERAREARYALLTNACLEYGIKTLVTAHHALDQWETVMMRLKRGSGITGLLGIAEKKKMPFGFLVRPFLKYHPDFFKKWLLDRNIEWIEDPSNKNEHFERIFLRNHYSFLSGLGLTQKSLCQVASHCYEADHYIKEQIDNTLPFVFFNSSLDLKKFKNLSPYLAKRVLQVILQNVSQKAYKTSWDLVTRLFNNIEITQTGGGCVLTKKKDYIFITKDSRINLNKI